MYAIAKSSHKENPPPTPKQNIKQKHTKQYKKTRKEQTNQKGPNISLTSPVKSTLTQNNGFIRFMKSKYLVMTFYPQRILKPTIYMY